MTARTVLNAMAAGCIGWWLILTWRFDCVWLWGVAAVLIIAAEGIHAATKPIYGPRHYYGPINHTYETPRRHP